MTRSIIPVRAPTASGRFTPADWNSPRATILAMIVQGNAVVRAMLVVFVL